MWGIGRTLIIQFYIACKLKLSHKITYGFTNNYSILIELDILIGCVTFKHGHLEANEFVQEFAFE
jgi:hypothetical protein